MLPRMSNLNSDAFTSGKLLDELAVGNAKLIQEDTLASGLVTSGITIHFSTMCSGGEVIIFALLAIQKFYNSIGVDLKFEHAFSCDKQ